MLFFKRFFRYFFLFFCLISVVISCFFIDYFYTQKLKFLANYRDSEEIIFQLQSQIQEQQRALSSLQMDKNLSLEAQARLQESYILLVALNCQQCNEIQQLKHEIAQFQQPKKTNSVVQIIDEDDSPQELVVNQEGSENA